MVVNYIYDSQGVIEYAVIPYLTWKKFEKLLIQEKEPEKNNNPTFDPSQYRGMLNHLNLDIENELQGMRNQWERDLLQTRI